MANSWGLTSLPALQSRVSAGTEAGWPANRFKGRKEGPRGRSPCRVPEALLSPRPGLRRRVGSSRVRARGWKEGRKAGDGSGVDAPISPTQPGPNPAPAALRSPSRLQCAGVRHSDPPSPRGGNSSRRSAAGFTSPSAEENTTAPLPPQGLAPRAGSPHSPASATAAASSAASPAPRARKRHRQQPRCACAGTWRYVAARRAKAKGERREPPAAGHAHLPGPAGHAHQQASHPRGHAPSSSCLLAAAGPGHPRGRSPAQSAREALIRLRASAGRCFVAESRTLCKLSNLRAYFC